MRRAKVLALAPFAVIAVALAAACGGGEQEATTTGAAQGTPERTLTVYSGREEELVAPLFEQFEQDTGIHVEARYGDSAELAATLLEEGDATPADVFFAQDAGALGAVAEEGLLETLPEETVSPVEERFRDPDGRWVGASGRARVLAYNTELVDKAELPQSVNELTDPRWKGRIGIAPTNASFQAFVSALRLTAGDEAAERWLEGIAANDPVLFDRNGQILDALAAGEIDVGLVNHYYLYELLAEQPEAPVANHFFAAGDPGALVNVAGLGVLAQADDRDAALELVRYLLEPGRGQVYFVDTTAEYPLVAGVDPRPELPPLADVQGPAIELGALGGLLEGTLTMISQAGLTA